MKISKYRVVTDNHYGYKAQVKNFLFWITISGRLSTSSFKTIEEAKDAIEYHKEIVNKRKASGKTVWTPEQETAKTNLEKFYDIQ